MKIKLFLEGNIQNLMRKCGYRFEKIDERTGEMAFSRAVEGASASGYPRFHIYLKQDVSRETFLNLHLDQKRPVYKGAVAHSGEYDGETVEREAERIRNILGP